MCVQGREKVGQTLLYSVTKVTHIFIIDAMVLLLLLLKQLVIFHHFITIIEIKSNCLSKIETISNSKMHWG